MSDATFEGPIDKEELQRELARRLRRAMDEKGWTDSDLARNVKTLLPNSKFDRSHVSTYMRGKAVPGSRYLNAMARALGKEPAELLPKRLGRAESAASPIDVRDIGGGKVWLRINQQTSWDKALKILELLKGED